MHRFLRALGFGLRHGLSRPIPRPFPWRAVLLVGALQALVAVGGIRVINWALVGRPLLPASFSLPQLAILLGLGIALAATRALMRDPDDDYPRHAATAAAWFAFTVLLANWESRVAQLGMMRAVALSAWLVLVIAGGSALITVLRQRDAYRRAPALD